MSTEMAQPYEHPPLKLYRVVTRWPRHDKSMYTGYRYYWDLEKGAMRYGISKYPREDMTQTIEEADIGPFVQIRP